MAHGLTPAQQHARMTQTPIPRLVSALCVSTVFNQLITVIYNTADTWFVSRIGTSASAAVGVVFSIMSIIQACGFGIAMGTGSLISMRLGAEKNEEANVIGSTGFLFSLSVGAVVGIVGIIFNRPLMILLGSTDSMLPYSCSYARVIFAAAPVMCGSFILGNILRSEGNAAFATVGLCIGGVFNVILDPIFIFKLGLGITGAALATAVSQLLSFVILLSAFLRGSTVVRLRPKSVSFRFETYKKIIEVGFPTICRQSLGSIASALLTRKARIYGDAAIAAVTIATKVYVLVRNIVLGIGQGFQPVAGYNYGAGNKKRTKWSFGFACLVGTGVCVVFALLFAAFPERIISWFRDDPDVVEMGAMTLRFFATALPFLAYSTFVNQLYQSLGFKGTATLLASCRQGIFFIPGIFILVALFGFGGIAMIQAVSDVLTFAVSVPFQIAFFRRHLSERGSEPK